MVDGRRSHGALLLLLHLAVFQAAFPAAAQSTRCAPRISFFPKGGEDRNVPHAWGKTAQMAAGNHRDDTMFNIVLTSTNNLPGIVAEAVPMLHISPVHPLLTVGSTNLPASCTGFVAQPATPDLAAADKGAAAIGGAPNAAAAAPAAGADAATAPAPAAAPPAGADAAAPATTPGPAAGVDVAESAQMGGPEEAAAALAIAAAAAAATADKSPEADQEPDAAAFAAHSASLAAKAAAAAANGTAEAAADKQEQPVNSTAPANRHLLSSSSSSWEDMGWQGDTWSEEGLVFHPGRHLLGGEAVTIPASYRLQYSLNGSEPIDTGLVSMMTPVQRIALRGLNAYPDGYYCLMLKLTIVAGTGRMAGYIPVPPNDLHSMAQVCFYKLDGAPSGKVSFSSCSENLGVTFKDLRPQPIPLHPGSPQSLFSSVFHFSSTLNRTKDWSWPSDAIPKKMDHWVMLDLKSAAGRPQLWVPEDKLADGWYNLRMEGSITSDFPSLLALNSMRAGKYEGVATPPELADKPKYLPTPQYKNGTVAGVQYVQTEFKQMTGPEEDMRLAVGDEMVLNWEFDGFGDMYCYSDGKLYNNMGDFQCRSPAQIRLPDRRNHTFRVALQDVCNNTFIVDAVYGTFGYKVMRTPPARAKTEEPLANTNGYTSGEKFELGAPANAVLRNPKAVTAKAAANTGLRPGHSVLAAGLWTVCVMLAAVFL